MNHNYAIIMAGGVGSGFWPVSRTKYPKPFLDILGTGKTLIQQTFRRIEKIVLPYHIYVITPHDYTGLVEDQLPWLPKKNILGEPEMKSNAASIAYLSFKIFKEDAEACVIIAPADHLISDDEEFARICRLSLSFVQQNEGLLILGIKPTHPHTGYGYIQYLRGEQDTVFYKVKEFKEKIDKELAMEYISNGDYLWNSGIFIWKAIDILKSFQKFLPQVYRLFNNEFAALNSLFEKEVIKKIYAGCPDVSIDFAILEKAENVFIIPALFAWSDLGTWNSAWENMNRDENKNAVTGKNVIVIDSTNCVVSATDNKLIVLQGLNDFIIIDTTDVLLICEKKKEQYIKEYVQQVKDKKDKQHLDITVFS